VFGKFLCREVTDVPGDDMCGPGGNCGCDDMAVVVVGKVMVGIYF